MLKSPSNVVLLPLMSDYTGGVQNDLNKDRTVYYLFVTTYFQASGSIKH